MSEEIKDVDSLFDEDNQPAPVADPAPAAATADPAPADPPADPPPAPAADPDPAPAPKAIDPPIKKDDPPGEPKPASTDPPDDRPGLERYLAEYGIEGGMIAFEEGEKVHVDNLTPDELHVVLNSLASEARPTVEQSLELSEDEISFLNMVRESKGNVSDVVADLANRQLDKIRNFEESQQINYDEMGDDAIYLAFLQSKNKELSQEELADDLEKAKETKTYDTVVTGLREDFKRTQETDRANNTATLNKQFDAEVDEDRRTVVAEVTNIKEVAGFEITDDHKNALLGDILELNDVGDSLLLEKVFASPQSIFEAAWFQKYGKQAIDNMENYWKQEASKAYARGRAEALGKLPASSAAPRISGMRNRANQPIDDGFNTQPDAKTLEDLYDD